MQELRPHGVDDGLARESGPDPLRHRIPQERRARRRLDVEVEAPGGLRAERPRADGQGHGPSVPDAYKTASRPTVRPGDRLDHRSRFRPTTKKALDPVSSVSSSRPSSATSSPVAGFGTNEWLVEEMYQQYLADPSSVDQAWHGLISAEGKRNCSSERGAEEA